MELVFRKNPPAFAAGETIVVEARFVNRTDKPQVYRCGLGDKNIKTSCQIALTGEGGKAWSARAAAAAPMANYNDITVPAGGQAVIGQWDLSTMVYTEGRQWRAGGKIPFADIARPGQYRLSWWDGAFQSGTSVRSKPVEFEIVQTATEPAAKRLDQADVSVRGRLQRAIDMSRTLAAKGQRIKDDLLRSIPLEPCEPTDRDKPLLFPRTEEVEAYMRDRPWASDYAPNPANLRPMRMMSSNAERWPTQADAPELRALLEDKDPAMRCVTAEALATLHQPEDVARIGRLLKDDADGLPVLGWNSLLTARPVGEQEIVAGGLQRMRSWHNRTVAATASGALKLMAGVDLTAKGFDAWWQRHSGGRNCVWYWQQRLTRELAAAEALAIAAWEEGDQEDPTDYAAKQDRILAQTQQRCAAVRQAVAAELAQLPAETEAKVRLCAINQYTPQGKKGGAYCLSGTNEHITIPNSDSLEIRDQVTLAVWVNLASLGPGGYGNEHGYIINKGDDLWWNPAFCLGYNKAGEPLFHVGNATDPQRGGGKSAFGETKLVPGQWVHLAGTYDGATVKLYVNGHLEREEKYCGQIRSDRAPVHLWGGKLFGVDWGNHFTVHGTIDEVMFFDRALSAEEIRQIYR